VGSAGFTTTANLGAQPEVAQVDPGSNAAVAGITKGDLVVAIDGEPTDGSLDYRLAQMLPGTTVYLRIENRKGQRDVKLKLGQREKQTYKLEDVPSITREQLAHRKAWIQGDDESKGAP
jgi:predicted metalloprotease with PDZ domain